MMPLEEFAAHLRRSRAPVFFTGAGISTESGVPDFRSPGGVWTKYQPVLFQDFLASESARVQHWQLKKATYELFKTVEPNLGHYAIYDFEKRGQLLGLITQNIDGLHRLAGTSEEKLIELHGTDRLVTCLGCGKVYQPADVYDAWHDSLPTPTCIDLRRIFEIGKRLLRPGNAGCGDAAGAGLERAMRNFYRYRLVAAGSARSFLSRHRQTERRASRHRQSRPDATRRDRRFRA
jgi:NAD-dependent SIR2 family protein deacetylase